jgi:hypothetical protein
MTRLEWIPDPDSKWLEAEAAVVECSLKEPSLKEG